MAFPNLTPPQKRFFKSVLITAVVFSITVLGLHIWFVNNARSVLKQIVTTKSQGKINLELSQLRFEFLSNKLQIREANLASNNKTDEPTTYRVKFRKLTLRVNSFWALLFKKELLLDSIKLHDPEIEVFRWRKDTLSKIAKEDLSISQEMGKLYNSMLDVLDGFGIERIIINNAKLSLLNKFKEGSQPVVITNIYFDLVRTADNVKKRDEFVANEQSVELITSDQNIYLPGGRHQLQFKKFRLELFDKRIELDSCTITARATDSSKSSYKIFFKRLSLVGVDFNAMYTQNLIRADSVYCENPLFDIDLNSSDASKKKGRPDPEQIVRELTGDLDLAFVGVKDAGIHINVSGARSRTLFNSNKDDFEMRGLRINADSSKPVTVARFDMLVRDYKLFNEDSSAVYSFDSVHFINNKIALNDFSISISSKNKERNKKDFKIPYFELTGLDWYELVFNENLSAEEASLYNPTINYTRTKSSHRRQKINLFASLQGIDTLLALKRINIINGQVNMDLGADASLRFQNANLSLFSDRLLQSRNREGLRKAVEELSFTHGLLRLKDILLNLENVRYTEKNFIRADRIVATSKNNKVDAVLKDVAIDNLLLDDAAELIIVDGIRWGQAKINVKSLPPSGNIRSETNLEIKNISSANTQFSFSNNKTSIKSFIQSLSLSSLYKKSNQSPRLTGLLIEGNALAINNDPLKLTASTFYIDGSNTSSISGLQVHSFKGLDSFHISSPKINFLGDINDFLENDFHLRNLEMQSPVVKLSQRSKPGHNNNNNNKKLTVTVDNLLASKPQVDVAVFQGDSAIKIYIPKTDGNLIRASGISLNKEGIQLQKMFADINAATFTKKTGEVLGVEKGKANIELSNIQLSRKNDKQVWSAQVDKLQLENPNSFSLGKSSNKLSIYQASLGNISLSSDYASDFSQILKYSVSAWVKGTTGQYVDSNTTLKWYNAGYDYSKKSLSLDSFSYIPTQSRDSVINSRPYQTDYITLTTGAVNIGNFDIDQYKRDSTLVAGVVDVANPIITIYRDKKPAFLSGVYKPLPVGLIKKIDLPILVNGINLNDGLLSYTERNGNTREEGTILLTHLNSSIRNLKNFNLGLKDSLIFSMDAYLMDSALINLRVKQAYMDSLSGFLMTLRMNPTSLSFLNPIVSPLSNVKIISGVVDSFFLRAIANENLAVGKVNMYYRNLRIKLYKNAELEESTFVTKALTFFANKFLIRKNNSGKEGIVYFERLTDRSFFNYLVKMTFSGMGSSIGVKKNKKYIRKPGIKTQLEKLPPLKGWNLQPE